MTFQAEPLLAQNKVEKENTVSKRIVIFVSVLLFQATIGFAKPEFTEVKAFRMFTTGSEKGEIIFIIVDENKAILSSPLSVEYTAMNKFGGSILFGDLLDKSWVIHDVWDNNKKGYRSVVSRSGEGKGVGYAKPIGRYESQRTRSLLAKTSFRFFGLKGYVDIYDVSNGKRIDGGPENEFSRNGEMLFVITGHNKGRFYGTSGSSEVDVFRDDSTVVFLETTGSGNKQVTIVQKRWNTKYDGFECTHIRNTIIPKYLSGGSELIRSIIPGVAKPQ